MPPQPQRPLSDRGDTDEIGNLSDRKTWVSGILVSFSYQNFHHDPHPIVVILYTDRRYSFGINVSYLDGNQRRQFKAGLKLWMWLDPRLKFYWLKTYNKSCLIAYRCYFTFMLHPLSAWVIPEVKDGIPIQDSMALLGKINGVKPTDWGKFSARVQGAAKARDVAVGKRPNSRPNQQRPSSRPNARPLLQRVQQALTRLEARVNSGSIRPPATRPRSQRPGS